MSRRIEAVIAANRRAAEKASGAISRDTRGRRERDLTFRNLEASLSATATLESRPLNDQFTIGHGDGRAVGTGALGQQTGGWSEVATADTVTVTDAGRDAFVSAIAGDAVGGCETVALGDDGTDADVGDTALGNRVTATDAWGEADGDDTAVGRAVVRSTGLPDRIREVVLETGDGTPWVRATFPDESPDGATEYRVTVDVTLSFTRTGAAAVTAIDRLRDRIRTEASDLTPLQLAIGTDGTDADASDTALGNAVVTADAETDTSGAALSIYTHVLRSEPATQPHDIAELGLLDADDTLLWRLTSATRTKDADTRLRPRTGIEV